MYLGSLAIYQVTGSSVIPTSLDGSEYFSSLSGTAIFRFGSRWNSVATRQVSHRCFVLLLCGGYLQKTISSSARASHSATQRCSPYP